MEIDVFISYHTDSSKHIVEAIVNKLEAIGVRCWYAPRDVEGDYAGSIVTAINRCKIFLLVLNKKASESPHVLNELNRITKRLSLKDDIYVVPFHIADEEISEAADYYIGRMHWIDAVEPPMHKRIDELADKISTMLGKAQISRTTSHNNDDYHLLTEQISADKKFKGREKELSEIHQQLKSKKNKLFLVGMGGSGKSELAKKYCEQYSDSYDEILWISFNRSLKDTFINDNSVNIYGLSRNDNLDKSEEEYFAYKLKILKDISDEKTLLVIDNFDVTEDDQLENLCNGKYTILFTTRCHNVSETIDELLLDNQKLSILNQIELFKSIYKREIENEEILQEILELLDGHILSIRLVASIMNSNRIKPEKIVDILKGNATDKNKSDIIYDRLKEMMDLSNLSNEEMYLLKNLSLVPIQGIDTERFVDWCEVDGFETIDGLVQKSWVIRDDATDVIHLHPIISDLAFEELSENFNNCDVFVHSIVANYKNTNEFNYSYKQWILTLINYICDRLSQEKNLYNELLFTKARVLHNLSLYPQAIDLYEYLTHVFSSRKKLIFIYRELSHLYCMSGFFEKSMSIAEESMKRFFDLGVDNLPDEEIYIYKGTITRLAEAARNLGSYDYAINVAEKALEISTKYFPKGFYSSIAWGKYHLARALYMRGLPEDIEKSEQLFLESILNAEEESDDWTKNYCIEFLAQVKMKKGEFDKALNDTKEIYNNYTSYYGESGVDRAINRVFLGNIYRSMGNEAEAVKYYNEAIEIFHKCGTFKLEENAKAILDSGKIGYVS